MYTIDEDKEYISIKNDFDYDSNKEEIIDVIPVHSESSSNPN